MFSLCLVLFVLAESAAGFAGVSMPDIWTKKSAWGHDASSKAVQGRTEVEKVKVSNAWFTVFDVYSPQSPRTCRRLGLYRQIHLG